MSNVDERSFKLRLIRRILYEARMLTDAGYGGIRFEVEYSEKGAAYDRESEIYDSAGKGND